MKICFPVKEDKGLSSTIFGHFGSAPMFLVVDSESGEVTPLINEDKDHPCAFRRIRTVLNSRVLGLAP